MFLPVSLLGDGQNIYFLVEILVEILEPGGQLRANTFSRVFQFHRIRVPNFYSKVFAVCANNDLEMHY